MIAVKNLHDDIPIELPSEHVTPLLATPGMRIERIVSRGHASAANDWYDQNDAEWVMVLAGSAGLLFEGEAEPRILKAGDYLDIPAHVRHRVAWTAADRPTIWLAVHHR